MLEGFSQDSGAILSGQEALRSCVCGRLMSALLPSSAGRQLLLFTQCKVIGGRESGGWGRGSWFSYSSLSFKQFLHT